MTIQEAIKLIDGFSSVYKGGQISRKTLNECISRETLIEYKEVAYKALKKQVPKKLYKSKENNQINYFCPVCRYYVGDEINIKYACLRPNFCPNCGQALDLSE